MTLTPQPHMDLRANQHPPEQAMPPPGRRQQLRDARAQLDRFTASHFHELPGRSNVVWCFMDYKQCAPHTSAYEVGHATLQGPAGQIHGQPLS